MSRWRRAGRGAAEEAAWHRLRVAGRRARRRRRRHSRRSRHAYRQGRRRHQRQAQSRDDGGRARRRRAVRRPSAGAPGPDLFRHPSLPSPDLQRRDRYGRQARSLRRHRGQAAHRQRADAGAGERLRAGRGDRQGHLGAGDALASRHGRADGAARAGPFRNRLRDAARRHARGDGRSGARAACRERRRATSCSAT